MITPLDDNTTTEVYVYAKANTTAEANIIPVLTSMLDSKTQAFADADANIASEFDTSILDKLDERLLD